MTAQPLPALTSGDPSAWDQALYAFLVEKGNRSGSRRTVESYGRMLWPFFADLAKAPDRVKPADVLAWVHGIGKSGRTPSACITPLLRHDCQPPRPSPHPMRLHGWLVARCEEGLWIVAELQEAALSAEHILVI
jgi:hypothetical protein